MTDHDSNLAIPETTVDKPEFDSSYEMPEVQRALLTLKTILAIDPNRIYQPTQEDIDLSLSIFKQIHLSPHENEDGEIIIYPNQILATLLYDLDESLKTLIRVFSKKMRQDVDGKHEEGRITIYDPNDTANARLTVAGMDDYGSFVSLSRQTDTSLNPQEGHTSKELNLFLVNIPSKTYLANIFRCGSGDMLFHAVRPKTEDEMMEDLNDHRFDHLHPLDRPKPETDQYFYPFNNGMAEGATEYLAMLQGCIIGFIRSLPDLPKEYHVDQIPEIE